MYFQNLKLKITLLAFILFSSTKEFLATIVKIEQILDANEQDIFLLSDNHLIKSKEGPKQFFSLTKSFSQSDQKFHIFIEVTPEIDKLINKKATALSNLKNDLDNLNLSNICHENFEQRLISGAAYFILKRSPNSIKPEMKFIIENNSCILGQITFNDLKNEFYNHSEQAKNELIQWSNDEVKTLAEKLLSNINKKFDKFINKISQADIQDNELIFSVSERLFVSNPELRKKIADTILNSFSKLLDLSLFLKMQKLNMSGKSIVVIAGYIHCENIKSLLLALDSKVVYNAGTKDVSLNPIELERVFQNLKCDFFLL